MARGVDATPALSPSERLYSPVPYAHHILHSSISGHTVAFQTRRQTMTFARGETRYVIPRSSLVAIVIMSTRGGERSSVVVTRKWHALLKRQIPSVTPPASSPVNMMEQCILPRRVSSQRHEVVRAGR